MPRIDIQADYTKVETESNKLLASLQKVNDRIKEVTSTVNKFNEFGVQTASVVKGLTNDGKEFTATLGLIGKSARDMAAAGIPSNLYATGIAFKETNAEATKAAQAISGFQKLMQATERIFLRFAAYKVFNFVTDQLHDGIKAAKEYQIQLSLIRTISQDSQQSFFKFGKDVRGVSDTSGFDLKQTGKAFYDAISNQITKGADTAPFVKSATDFARVTGSELPDSVNLLSSAINAYGLSAKDADRLSAIFFRTIDEGRVVASELANTFGRVAVLGSNMGVKIEDLNATIAITTQKGFKTSDSLTLLTNLLTKLEKPTEKTKKFFQDLGVDTGEAAIKLYGFTGVLQKMVDAVKSGRNDVSDFFDEIRGRKQFAIFEQSVGQIDTFSRKLQDTTATMKIYQKAIEIRGESPADLLVKEANKLKNIFTADLGQAILAFAANVIKSTGGVDGLKNSANVATEVMKALGLGIAVYTTYTIGATIANAGLVVSLKAVTVAGATLFRLLLPLAVAYGTFKGSQSAFEKIGFAGSKNFFGGANPEELNASIEALDRYKKKIDDLKSGSSPDSFASLNRQKATIDSTFQTVLGFVAEANKANNQMLGDAKTKSKEMSDVLKVQFGTWTDRLKDRISEINRKITETRHEVEKSQKAMLKFDESLDTILYNTREKYATDAFGGFENQKIQVAEARIKSLTEKATRLFSSGDKDQVAEARHVFDEIARIQSQVFDRRTDVAKKQYEEALHRGLVPQNPDGINVFTVDTAELQNRLNALLAYRNQLEEEYQKKQKVTAESKKTELETEKARLRTAEIAIKQYDAFDAFDKNGKLKKDYQDSTGRLDTKKLNEAFNKLESDIGGSLTLEFTERIQLELLFMQKRKALNAEVEAELRKEYLKTQQARILSENESFTTKIENLKKERTEQQSLQGQLLTAIGQKPNELALFANKAIGAGGVNDRDKQVIAEFLGGYKKAVTELFDNLITKDGVTTFDPDRLSRAQRAYENAVDKIQQIRDKAGKNADLSVEGPGGRNLTPGQAKAAFEQQVEELLAVQNKLGLGTVSEKFLKESFNRDVKGPVDALKEKFPELAESSKLATDQMNISFRNLANGGVKDLEDKLREIQKLMQQMGNPGQKISSDTETSQATYAASGGISGFFPGQPRGSDVYPIWAARGETIIDSATSRLYRPMLDAIMQRRMPRYMAGGGVVGDTTIGDINVTVNGATTNNDTGRAIGDRLERELRRKNIRLSPR